MICLPRHPPVERYVLSTASCRVICRSPTAPCRQYVLPTAPCRVICLSRHPPVERYVLPTAPCRVVRSTPTAPCRTACAPDSLLSTCLLVQQALVGLHVAFAKRSGNNRKISQQISVIAGQDLKPIRKQIENESETNRSELKA